MKTWKTSNWVVIIAAIIGAAGMIMANMVDNNTTPSNSIDNPDASINLLEENQPPRIMGLTSSEPDPQSAGKDIHWEAAAYDPENDLLLYKFLVNGEDKTGWITDKRWTWETEDYIGDSQIDVWVRDSKRTDPDNFDDHRSTKFSIEELQPAYFGEKAHDF